MNHPILIAVFIGTLLPATVSAQVLAYLTQWGSLGSGSGQFYYPASVAVDASGNVYVSDQVNHRVQKFTSDGTFLTQWSGLPGTGLPGGDAGLCFPIAADKSRSPHVHDGDDVVPSHRTPVAMGDPPTLSGHVPIPGLSDSWSSTRPTSVP